MSQQNPYYLFVTKVNFKNKKITVMGLGTHGGALGNIFWLSRQGAHLTITDLKPSSQLQPVLKKINSLANIELVLGKHRPADFTQADMILQNPAVPRDSKYLTMARHAKVPIEMDSSIFFRMCPTANIIGVTGSKGKSSTTSFIAQLLNALAIGIEGTSPLAALDQITHDTIVVFELSSWRLEPLAREKISPPIAVVTSIYPDHLNTYSSFAEYEQTKKSLILNQSKSNAALLNADDEKLLHWENNVPGKLFWYSIKPLAGKDGICLEGDWVTLIINGVSQHLLAKSLIPFNSLHEIRNVLPAIFLANYFGFSNDLIEQKVQTLHALPHRMQIVQDNNSRHFINDSAATIPDATIAALQSLRGKKIIHILGGNDKGLDFRHWANIEAGSDIKKLIWLPGNANGVMKDLLYSLQRWHDRSVDAPDMAQAVTEAYEASAPGDIILLSPGATSFGSFKHEFDRGEQFMQEVRKIK